jgi:hypothetical protein
VTAVETTEAISRLFIGSRAIANNLSASDFRFRDLRRQPTTVYIILPTRHLSNSGKWFRLLIASALNDLLIEEEKGTPCLCVLDEFAQLGNLKLIEDANPWGSVYAKPGSAAILLLGRKPLSGPFPCPAARKFLNRKPVQRFSGGGR